MNNSNIRIRQTAFAALFIVLSASSLKLNAQSIPTAAERAAEGYRIKETSPVNTARVTEIVAMLPDQPKGYGVPYNQRDAWDKLLKSGDFNSLISDADEVMKSPIPELTDEVYLSFFNSNDSERSKKLVRKRIVLFSCLVWAECLKNNGKYMPAIEAALSDIISSKSWNFPAEDRKKTNFNGTQYTINLSPAAYAQDITQALYLLGDKINPALRKKTIDALYKFIFDPAMQAIKTNNKNEENSSLTNTTGNHNTVTIAGVTAAALTIIPDKKERATYVAIAEKYIKNTLAGFLNDGYCSEGLGYYNYGFKHYVFLRETLLQSTGGKIDIFKDPKVEKIAHYVPNIEIINNVYPTIGDCNMNEKPAKFLMYYLNKQFNLGLKQYDNYVFEGAGYPPLQNVMYVFPNEASKPVRAGNGVHKAALYSYFNEAGVITVRPSAGSSFNLAATLKGGNNGELHNHNDIGSYTLVAGKEMLSGDPGLATYTSKTFTPERYNIKTIASYGHPVPLVAGKEQFASPKAEAKILSTNFSEHEDRVVMDIRSGYKVPELKKLLRGFIYNRGGKGYFEVSDDFEFSSPQTFETAIITRSSWKKLSDNTIELSGNKEKVIVTIQAPAAFSIVSEVIKESPKPYTRLAIRLNEPIQAGKISMTYKNAKQQ